MHRGLLPTMLVAFVACSGATGPTRVVRVAPSASASPGSPKLAFDPAITVVHRESIALVSKPDHADRVFALAADGTTLVAIDTRTGAEAWRSALALAKGERVSIYPDFGAKQRVVVHAGSELVFVDRDSGIVVARAEALRNFKSTSNIVSTVEQPYGACVVHTECMMQPIDCDDGHPIGPDFHRTTLHLYREMGKPHDTVCRGKEDVVGRAGGVIVALAVAESPVLHGIDANSGAIAWSRTLTCRDCSSGPSGVSEDGATCFISGHTELEAFACATGHTVFTRALAPASVGPEVFTAAVPGGGIFVSDAATALVLDPKMGRPVWSKKLDPGALALPLGTRLDLPEFSTWGAHTLVLLDSKDGREAARFAQPGYVELRQGADLGLRLERGPAYDSAGAKLYDVPPATYVEKEGRLLAPDGKALASGATAITVVAARASSTADVVTFEVWTEGRLDLVVAQRAR